MRRKLTYKYQMDFKGKPHQAAAAFMGGAFFLRIAYYFGFTRPEEAGFLNLLMYLILPLLIEGAFMVMIRGLRVNLSEAYTIMGAAYCIILLLQSFQTGNLLRVILAVIAYLACAAALVGTGWGVLNKSLTTGILLVTLAVRLLVFDLSGYVFALRVIPFIREAAALCGIASLACLSGGLKDKKRKKANPAE